MRRECPAFVPFSTNIWLQKRIRRSPKLHENINVSSSVRTFPDGTGILKKWALYIRCGWGPYKRDKGIYIREKWSRMKTSSNGEKESHETHEAALKLEGKKGFLLTRKWPVLRHKVWTTSVWLALLGSSLREKADTTTSNCTWCTGQGTWQTWHLPLLRVQQRSIPLNFFCFLLFSNT